MQALGWRASWQIARRDLHAGFRGLRLLLVCLFLGVATLATIGSLTASITAELSARGQALLGGDVEVAMTQRQASAAEHAALAELGAVGDTIRTRAMARRAAPTSGAIVDLLFDRQRAADATLLIITHDPALAERCDRVLTMRDGLIVADSAA